jgi:hypothetical protein
MGGVYDGTNFFWYKTIEDLLDYQLNARTHNKVFYAHNGGRADFTFMLQYLRESVRGLRVDACFSGSSANIVTIHQGRYRWHFVDSLWLFRDSLDTIGEAIGMPKGGPEVEYGDGEDAQKKIKDWYAYAPLSELVPYCKQDCEILWQAIHLFQIEMWQLGSELKKTIASTALTLFRRRYLKHQIQTHQIINRDCRDAYHASRTEKLIGHMESGRYYDINSSFPYSMKQPQPGQFKIERKRLGNSLDADVPLVLADCEIEVPESLIPPLPFRAHHKVYFPVGRWRTWFTGVDLKALLERGGKIHACHHTYEFHAFHDMSDYVDEIYGRRRKAREAGNVFKSMVYKFLLNSLYGKTAESREKTSLIINPTAEQREHYGLRKPMNEEEAKEQRCKEIKIGVWTVPKTVTIPHEHVPIAAHVTAYSRLLLLRHLESAEQRGGNAYYCDTDGFATDVEYPTGPNVGDLKCEATIRSADFYCPKVYRMELEDGTKVLKAKGFHLPRKDPEASERIFDEIVSGSTWIERMMRPMELLKSKVVFTPGDIRFQKRLLMEKPKRSFFEDGTSRPWHVRELVGEG